MWYKVWGHAITVLVADNAYGSYIIIIIINYINSYNLFQIDEIVLV